MDGGSFIEMALIRIKTSGEYSMGYLGGQVGRGGYRLNMPNNPSSHMPAIPAIPLSSPPVHHPEGIQDTPTHHYPSTITLPLSPNNPLPQQRHRIHNISTQPTKQKLLPTISNTSPTKITARLNSHYLHSESFPPQLHNYNL